MNKITVLGLGAMGARVAAKLADAGYSVTGWNRTPGKVDVQWQRFELAEDLEQAVKKSELIFIFVTDDKASKALWADLEPLVRSEQVLVECSTLSPDWVDTLTQTLEGRCHFVSAPVIGSRPQAENNQLVFLLGAARAQPGLKAVVNKVAGKVVDFDSPKAAAVAKLVVNGLFGIQVAALAEAAEVMKRQGLNLAEVDSWLNDLPIMSMAAKGAWQSILGEQFSPLFPLPLVAKDFGYLNNLSEEALPLIRTAAEQFQQAAEAVGGVNITGISQYYARR